ncbi:MAG: HIT family protein [Bauldia sp.]|nr:HIT family protein [Bauldia sp.]
MAYDPDNIFAKILRGELPAHKVYEDDATLAFMDIMPISRGHVLVLSKAPARNILDIDAADLARVVAVVQRVARAAKEALGADGVTIQQFNEPAGGQTVFHLHFHVVPRWEGQPLRPHGAIKADPADLKRDAEQIAALLV